MFITRHTKEAYVLQCRENIYKKKIVIITSMWKPSLQNTTLTNLLIGQNKINSKTITLTTRPISVVCRPAVLRSSLRIIIKFLMSWIKNKYIRKLIIMKKVEPRTVGLKPTEIEHVGRGNVRDNLRSLLT